MARYRRRDKGAGGGRRLAFQGAGDAWGLRKLLEKLSFEGVTLLLYMTQIIKWVSDLGLYCWR